MARAQIVRPPPACELAPKVALMGDIIGSRRLNDSGLVAREFKAIIQRANARNGKRILSPLTITLGDEFQGLVAGHRAAFEIANELRLGLLQEGIGCRFALGAVQLTTPLNPIMAWGMNGPGLAEVRTLLNQKNDLAAYQFIVPPSIGTQALLDALAAGLSHFEDHWTSGQLAATSAVIVWGQSPKTIAANANVTPRAVRKQLQGADFARYQLMRDAVVLALNDMDRNWQGAAPG